MGAALGHNGSQASFSDGGLATPPYPAGTSRPWAPGRPVWILAGDGATEQIRDTHHTQMIAINYQKPVVIEFYA